jgi:hypothetical protein
MPATGAGGPVDTTCCGGGDAGVPVGVGEPDGVGVGDCACCGEGCFTPVALPATDRPAGAAAAPAAAAAAADVTRTRALVATTAAILPMC